jgi:hypothetical protein
MTGGSPSAAGIGPWIIRRNLFYAKELNRLTSKDFQLAMHRMIKTGCSAARDRSKGSP